jgi:membrane protease YdiL (CAAX protease family)
VTSPEETPRIEVTEPTVAQDVAPAELPITRLRREPAWGIIDLLIVLLFVGASFYLCGIIGLAIAAKLPALHNLTRQQLAETPLVLVPIQALSYLLAFIFVRMFITLRAEEDFWAAIKWNFLPATEMLTFAFAGVVLALVTQVIGHFLPIPKELPMDKYFVQPAYVYLMMAFGLLIAPLAEELFFRGLLFPVAVRYLGLSFGTAVTAFLFALIHQAQLAHAWAPLSLLFIVGFVLTAIRAATRSVAASWVTHFSYNATLFALLIYATGGLKHLDRM